MRLNSENHCIILMSFDVLGDLVRTVMVSITEIQAVMEAVTVNLKGA